MESRVDELKRYVRFSTDDAQRLAAFGPEAAPHFERVAQEFYDRVREHEEAHAVFTGEDQISRLQASMVRWLGGVFGGVYDEAYFARTGQVGRVHVKVGLPQRYMLTAMALIRSSLTSVIVGSGRPDAPAVADALSRLLDIELAVMLESYRDDLVARVKRAVEVEQEASSRRAARSDAYYVAAVELAPVVVVGIDARGEVLLFNPAAERATGYARDEVLGRAFVDLFLPEEERRRAPNFGDLRPGATVELTLVTRAHKFRDFRWQVARDAQPGGALFLVGGDVTDERAERERRQQQERLAAVGALAAGLAHEIRNPLNGARLHVSFLERTLSKSGGSAETLDAVHVVGDEIQRLARLVTDFLDFARPRPLAYANTSIRALCDRAARLVSSSAETAGVELDFDLPPRDVVFEADAQRLEQVLLNLLQNGIEALAPAGGQINVRARREPRHVWLEVEDDGPGLPEGHVPVFDAFFSTKPNGTGLGLAIVHRIVTDHGGTIDVDSRPGRTRFRLKLPLARQGTEP